MPLTATELAARVRAGTADPVELTREALRRIAAADGVVGAFRAVRGEAAVAEAAAVRDREDLARLPLAGVPVAVKDVVDVSGEYAGWGSHAAPQAPASADHVVVARLRAAGAVIIGMTRVPELCIWPFSDDDTGIARNPWNPSVTAGGSSGGSGAAVAAGLVPIAHGTDGLGSVRLPAAICGLVGIKPGYGVLGEPDMASWYGMSTHGPLASTVTDAAAMLSVLAERPDLGEVTESATPLRIAVSTRAPLGMPIGRAMRVPAMAAARSLGAAGHTVCEATPSYGTAPAGMLARWFAGPIHACRGWDRARLQPRTRRHLALGRAVIRAGLVREASAQRLRRKAGEFFSEHDILLTPTLASAAPPAHAWRKRPWLANVLTSLRFAPFTGPWNLAGFPAITVPSGADRHGSPLGVQLVAAPGREQLLIGVAAALERMNGWPRTVALAPDGPSPW